MYLMNFDYVLIKHLRATRWLAQAASATLVDTPARS